MTKQIENDPALPLRQRLRRIALGERLREENPRRRPSRHGTRVSGDSDGLPDEDRQVDADFGHDHLTRER